MKGAVLQGLWSACSHKKHACHGDLSAIVHTPPVGNRWYRLLDEACLEVVSTGGPLVTSLVTARHSRLPGHGFLTLAERLCLDWKDPVAFMESEQKLARQWISENPDGWDLRC